MKGEIHNGEHGKGGAGYTDGANDAEVATEKRRLELMEALPNTILFLLDAERIASGRGDDRASGIIHNCAIDVTDALHMLIGDYDAS